MYFYYTLTCFGYRPTWKRILTTMQIVQFCVGNPLGLAYALLPDCLPLEIIPPENVVGKLLGSQIRSLYACLFVNTFFISSLVILFTDFSRKTYGPGNKKATEEPKKVSKTKTAEAKAVKSIKAVKETTKSSTEAKTVKTATTTANAKSPKVKASAVPASPKKTVKKSKKEAAPVTEAPVTTTRRSRRS